MSRADTLKSLEIILESFLDRAVALKESRLNVLGGLNRLDDLARACSRPGATDAPDLADRIGGWFAEHRTWLHDQSLRTSDRVRLGSILNDIQKTMLPSRGAAPSNQKIASEIHRWQNRLKQPPEPVLPGRAPSPLAPTDRPAAPKPGKIVLRRGGETLDEAGVHPSGEDSIGLFDSSLDRVYNLFKDISTRGQHLMSVLDDALKSAVDQKNREALLLSALIIYYLKQNGYMVQPFVKRLKQAEQLQKASGTNA